MMSFHVIEQKYGCHGSGAMKLQANPTIHTGTTMPARFADEAHSCSWSFCSIFLLSGRREKSLPRGIIMMSWPCSRMCAILYSFIAGPFLHWMLIVAFLLYQNFKIAVFKGVLINGH